MAAVVSGRYAPLDPDELLGCVRDALVRFDLLGQVRVRGVASGLVDNMRLILPGDHVAVKVGDVSHVGLDISTSSFGRSAIHLGPMVWRLVCTNGLRSPERRGQLSFRHVGDRDRLRTGIAEAIPSALAHARGLMDQWRRSVTFMVEDVQRQVEAMRDLTNPERKAFESQIKVEAGTAALPRASAALLLRQRADADGEESRACAPAPTRRVRGGRAPAARRERMKKDILTRPFPPEQLRTRRGANGKQFSYVEAHTVVTRLNEAPTMSGPSRS